ncbi:phage terminase small subunit [Streptomyces sp. GS7]|uniref:phage terminase small subunit n=1 Tax=Streptomyces sp. GS7 TaxID=2692234 RepID=UPI003FA778C0
MPGPVPKRSDQRRRRNEPDGPALVKAEAGKAPTVPRADGSWHPIAKQWFQSLKDSGQAQFYEQSDWLAAGLSTSVVGVRPVDAPFPSRRAQPRFPVPATLPPCHT